MPRGASIRSVDQPDLPGTEEEEKLPGNAPQVDYLGRPIDPSVAHSYSLDELSQHVEELRKLVHDIRDALRRNGTLS